MPPRNFAFNPAKAAATQRIYEKGTYEFVVGEPKAFYRDNTATGGKESFGVFYPLTIAEGEYKGERILHNLYLHTEATAGMNKQFIMAVLGYNPRDNAAEQSYNEEHANDDFAVNFESLELGQGWHQLTGNRVIFDLDITINKQTGDPQQKVARMNPI
jgi:hypothetical protein